MKWSMWACDTKTASIGRRSAPGTRSMRPRSSSRARPCQRRVTRRAGSPVCPFNRRGRKVVFMGVGILGRPRGGRQRGPWPGSPQPAIRRGHGGRVARGGRVGTARAALLGLQLLEDHARRFGHHLLHDLAHRLAVGLELRDQRGENREVALLGLDAHGVESAIHRLDEATMGSDDLSVEVLDERTLRHAGSIRAPSRRFNAIALIALGACFLPGAAAALEVPGSDGRLAVSGYLDGRAVADTGGGPRERPQALLDLRLDGTPTRALHTHLELRTRAGGPFEGGHPGLYNFNHAFQNRSPAVEVDESYADLHLRSADVRIGIQKVAWGKLDGVPPTDVVNPRDFHDPLVDDVEERKIGIPALLGTYYLPDVPRLGLTGLRTTLVYVPLAVPPRLALAEERWFPRSTVPPARFVVPPAVASRALGMPVTTPLVIPVTFGTLNDHPPFGGSSPPARHEPSPSGPRHDPHDRRRLGDADRRGHGARRGGELPGSTVSSPGERSDLTRRPGRAAAPSSRAAAPPAGARRGTARRPLREPGFRRVGGGRGLPVPRVSTLGAGEPDRPPRVRPPAAHSRSRNARLDPPPAPPPPGSSRARGAGDLRRRARRMVRSSACLVSRERRLPRPPRLPRDRWHASLDHRAIPRQRRGRAAGALQLLSWRRARRTHARRRTDLSPAAAARDRLREVPLRVLRRCGGGAHARPASSDPRRPRRPGLCRPGTRRGGDPGRRGGLRGDAAARGLRRKLAGSRGRGLAPPDAHEGSASG